MYHPTDRTAHTMSFVTPVVEHWLEWEMGPLWGNCTMSWCPTQNVNSNIVNRAVYDIIRINTSPINLRHVVCMLSYSSLKLEQNVERKWFPLKKRVVCEDVKDGLVTSKLNILHVLQIICSHSLQHAKVTIMWFVSYLKTWIQVIQFYSKWKTYIRYVW